MNTQKTGIRRWLKGVMLERMPGMITCREFEDFICDYLDGTLPAAKRRVFELHMRICRECREYLAAYQKARALGQATALPGSTEPVPDDVPEDLIKAILESRRE